MGDFDPATGGGFSSGHPGSVDIDGYVIVPTALYYPKEESYLVGGMAISKAITSGERHRVNEEFKIEIGNTEPGKAAPRNFIGADSKSRSALTLAADYIYYILQSSRSWLDQRGIPECKNVVLAEPLSMQADLVNADWLSNYRRNLERMLNGKGFGNIDFIPEPFAAFQYYRYGLKHPYVAQRTKHRALVLDFGGGTFDTCIIETTKEGDISETGRNSRPLSATSRPIGGFFYNRCITKYLFDKYLKTGSNKNNFSTGYEQFKKWKKGDLNLSATKDMYASFVLNFNDSAHRIEEMKLAICRSIDDWSLDSTNPIIASASLPKDPFSNNEERLDVNCSSIELREIFVNSVWRPGIKPTIEQTLKRAHEELQGAPLTVVLLSGGSANIGWLRELVKIEFEKEISEAEVLILDDYQEVVAKGLAIECARRFYSSAGDFSSTTYNRLCLVLNPDASGMQIKSFKYEGHNDAFDNNPPGVLLNSASLLRSHIGKEMEWRVRLDKPPKRKLDYYFLRSSFSHDDIENLQNAEEHTLHTPKNVSFDSSITVQLNISEDGTAHPKFVYKKGKRTDEAVFVNGKPFYMDMTYGKTDDGKDAYLGFDLGTSNSALCYISRSSIQIYNRRSQQKGWLDLGELVNTLPYPLAEPLSRYLCEDDSKSLLSAGLEFIEAALCLAAYVTYLDFCTVEKRAETKLFKSFTQRSAGPLWALLKDTKRQIRDAGLFSKDFDPLINEHYDEINSGITILAQKKHQLSDGSEIDINRIVSVLGNVCQKVFSSNLFGCFENVQKEEFGLAYRGYFKIAHGKKPPFINKILYEGESSFSKDQVFLYNSKDKKALLLQPLIFREICETHAHENYGHIFLYDKYQVTEDVYNFKAVGFPCQRAVTLNTKYKVLAKKLSDMRDQDRLIATFNIG